MDEEPEAASRSFVEDPAAPYIESSVLISRVLSKCTQEEGRILSDAHGNILLDVDLLRSAREEERANKSCGLKPRESRLAE